MLNSLMFLLRSFEVLTCRRPSQDLLFKPQMLRAAAGLTPSMVLTADIKCIREKTKCQAFVMNTTCFRHCQPFEPLILLQRWQWEGGKGAGDGQKDFKAKALKNKPQFPSSPGSTPETSLPETKQREEGWGWILCFVVYLNSTWAFIIDLAWNIVISASAQNRWTYFGICFIK